MNASIQPHDVVRFWRAAGPGRWFAKDDAFDRDFVARFADLHMAAARRELTIGGARPTVRWRC